MVSMQSWPWREACMLPTLVCTRTCIDLWPVTIDITSQQYRSQHQLERVRTCDWRHVTTSIFAFMCLEYLCVGWDVMGGRVRPCDKWETTAGLQDKG